MGGSVSLAVLPLEFTDPEGSPENRAAPRKKYRVLCGGCNMRVILVELSEERDCHKCGSKIAVGEKAIKTVSRSSSCSASEIFNSYVHEHCWKPRVGKK